MKYSFVNGSILLVVAGGILVNLGFTEDCANQLMTNIPVLITGTIAWFTRWSSGKATLGGFRKDL